MTAALYTQNKAQSMDFYPKPTDNIIFNVPGPNY